MHMMKAQFFPPEHRRQQAAVQSILAAIKSIPTIFKLNWLLSNGYLAQKHQQHGTHFWHKHQKRCNMYSAAKSLFARYIRIYANDRVLTIDLIIISIIKSMVLTLIHTEHAHFNKLTLTLNLAAANSLPNQHQSRSWINLLLFLPLNH